MQSRPHHVDKAVEIISSVALVICLVLGGLAAPWKTAPAMAAEGGGFFEIQAPLHEPGIVALEDGSLLMAGSGRACLSRDGGRTWGAPWEIGVTEVVRLQSGLLGGRKKYTFHVSRDNGRTWQPRGKMPRGYSGSSPLFDTMIQTRDGRIYQPMRTSFEGFDGCAPKGAAWGAAGGSPLLLETHAQYPEIDLSFVYYSDDEGHTWKRSQGMVMVWLRQGKGGIWPCDEPNLVELGDGSLAMYCRTTLGSLFVAYSRAGQFTDVHGVKRACRAGQRFSYPVSSGLASSYSPCRIRRIPGTGDLLCVWNQVSRDETRAGYRRGRLCSAISRDDGKTWRHFRTITSKLMPPAGRVRPPAEPAMTRAISQVGKLPQGFGLVHYPNFSFHAKNVLLTWQERVFYPRSRGGGNTRLRIVPLQWFYGQDQSAPSGQGAPRLYLQRDQTGPVAIKSQYYHGLFWISLSDIAAKLHIKIRCDMYAPLQQIMSKLGIKAALDISSLKDEKNPHAVLKIKGL